MEGGGDRGERVRIGRAMKMRGLRCHSGKMWGGNTTGWRQGRGSGCATFFPRTKILQVNLVHICIFMSQFCILLLRIRWHWGKGHRTRYGSATVTTEHVSQWSVTFSLVERRPKSGYMYINRSTNQSRLRRVFIHCRECQDFDWEKLSL